MKSLIAIAALLALFAVASESDYQEQLDHIEDYCGMVEHGYWPPYKPNHDEICKEDK